MRMSWKESLSVDVVSIDREHEALAAALDDLFGRLRQGMSREDFLAGVDAVIAAVTRHFENEERVMRNIGLPEYLAHARLHGALVEEIRDFRRDVAENFDPSAIEPVEQFLRFWLYKHISSEDHKIRDHLHRS